MPSLHKLVLTFLALSTVLAAPLPAPQLAGEGSACNSVLSSTDNGVGYGVENAEDNTAALVSSTKGGARRRQLAGEGSACDSILTSTDNGVGYGTENAEDNTANTITSAKGGSSSSNPPPPAVSSRPSRRQLDKIAKGAGAIGDAAGGGAIADPVATGLEGLDGTLTSGAASAGAEVGTAEESSLENAGKSVPRL